MHTHTPLQGRVPTCLLPDAQVWVPLSPGLCFGRKKEKHLKWGRTAGQSAASFAVSLFLGDFPVAQIVNNLPATQKTGVQSLGWEDPLKKEMATHSGILAWRIPWTEEPGGLQSLGLQRVRHD